MKQLVDGTQSYSTRCVWQAVGRDSDHALQLAWQHSEGESLDGALDVWDAAEHEDDVEFENRGMNYGYPFPIAPQW